MRRTLLASTAALLLCLCGQPSAAQTTTETFTGGSNTGGWTFGGPGGSIPQSGGNPGAYLASGLLDTFAPQPRTTQSGTPFTGDFRAAGVTAFGVDLITFLASTTAGRPLALMLIHDNQTPAVASDDTAAYFLGPNIPAVGAGWQSYDYEVPAAERTLPAGWQLLNLGDVGSPPIDDWNTVIQDVDRVVLHYGDPTFVFIFQQWQLGLDNPRITAVACSSAAGAVPDGKDVPGDVLTVSAIPNGNLRLRWQDSCNACDTDYEVYEGTIGDYASHTQKLCSTSGAKQAVFAAPAESAYYLVVPTNGLREGSYGTDGAGVQRPVGVVACRPQAVESCR